MIENNTLQAPCTIFTGDNRVYHFETMFGGRPNGSGICLKKRNKTADKILVLNH